MSSTTCQTCKGYGTVCGRCGRARKRQVRNWYGTACCYRAKIKRCPSHIPTAYACDVCLKPAASVKWSSIAGAYRDACPSCVVGWERWLAVASDAFLESLGNSPQVDAMARALAAEHVRAVAFVAGFNRELADKLAGHLYAATVDRPAGLVTPSSRARDSVG